MLVKQVYALTSSGAFSQDRGLKDQIQRASVSICSNIAEGFARNGNKDMSKFLWIAKGSAAEVQSQLYHAIDIGYIDRPDFDALYTELNRIQRGLYRLIQTLSDDPKRMKIPYPTPNP